MSAAESEAEALVARGIEMAEGGDAEAAVPLFQQAVQLVPGHGPAWEMLAQCCMEVGQDSAALAAARTACELLPASAEALVTLGRAARNAGQLKESVAAFEAALASVQQESGPGGGSSSISAQGEEGGSDEVGVWRQELLEVQQLREQEVGHSIGLPGLRIREAAAGSQLGPASVVWESGVLLARLLVSCSQGAPGAGAVGAHACGPGCGGTAAAAAAAAVPLPGLPTFSLPPEAAQPAPAATAPLAGPSWLAGARVLELGSGTGVVGLAAACLGAHVTATDLPEALPQLQGNIALNASAVAAAGGSIEAQPLDWAAAGVEGGASAPAAAALLSHSPPFDLILGADLVYSPAPVPALVRTLAALAAAGSGSGGDAANGLTVSGRRGHQQVKLLLAHKHRHQEVDSALLEGLRGAGLPLRVVARDADSRVTIYGNAPAAAALGL